MSSRLHFFTLVLILLTTLSFNGVAPQTNAARLLRFLSEELEKAQRVSGSSSRVLEQKDIKNPDSPAQSVPSKTQTEEGPEDMRANPKPRVMGHGRYRIWRAQPSGLEEEENMESREVIFSKKPKHGRQKALSPKPGPRT